MKGGGNNLSLTPHKTMQDRPTDGKIGTRRKIQEIVNEQGVSQDEAANLAYGGDSQLIASVINTESFAIIGSQVNKTGRDIKFMDGILSAPGKESPLTKLIAISTHHTELINTICVTKISNANTLNSLRMGSGSPMVVLPLNTRRQLERAANSCKYLLASSAYEAFPPQLDHEENSFLAIFSSDATANMFCLVVHEDQFLMEIYLMKEGESLKEVRNKINFADASRLEWAYKAKRTRTGEDIIISNLLTFNSRRKFNLSDWGHMNLGGETKTYPEDSSQTNYLNVLNNHIPAKMDILRNSMDDPDAILPWKEAPQKSFYWSPDTILQDLTRLSVNFPTITSVTLEPTPVKVYVAMVEQKVGVAVNSPHWRLC